MSPVIPNVEPSNVKLDSTVAFGAEPFNVIIPLLVEPTSDNNPEVPLIPLVPEDPSIPLTPSIPLIPLTPLVLLPPTH